jgi:hypothetical protein
MYLNIYEENGTILLEHEDGTPIKAIIHIVKEWSGKTGNFRQIRFKLDNVEYSGRYTRDAATEIHVKPVK